MSELQAFDRLITRKITDMLPVQTWWVTVSEVNWDKKTMKGVGVKNGTSFFDVSLGLNSFYRKPKIGSICLIGIAENQAAETFLIQAEQVEEFVYKSKGSELTIKEKGFIVKQGNESLKMVLNDWQEQFLKLCDELSKVVVSIGVSPNVPVIKQIKDKVKDNIQKRLNSILIK